MIKAFQCFIEKHYFIRETRLRLLEQRKNEFIVCQGSQSSVWARLSKKVCYFNKTSLLRSILRLPEDHILKQYFGNYSISTGSERNVNL